MTVPAAQPQRPQALVIGGAKRVGRAIAVALARAGCDVAITFRSSRGEADATVRDLITLGSHASAFELDLADVGGVHGVAHRVVAALGRLDVLVLSASAYGPSPLEELDAKRLLADYVVNAAAPVLIAKACAPFLAASTRAGGGAIVAMHDMHALGRPRRDFASYSMSKAALGEMVLCLARDLAPRVRVNAVAPGVVLWPDSGYESDAAAQKAYLSRVPLARAGTPEDAAEAVRWLALDAHYVTGEILRLDGGRWLA